MKKNLKLIILLIGLLISCENFEFEANTDTFFHVKIAGAALPVWVKGNTESRKLVVFINGGPGLTSIDIAEIDMLGWGGSLEKEFAVVYYDQRGTGNAQGNIDPKSITMDQYLADLKAIIQVLNAKYPNVEIYLMGHSFGGLIGQQFLLDENRQSMISGWININGSTIVDIDKEWVYRAQFLRELAIEKLAEDQEKWSEAIEWLDANEPITTSEQKREWRSFIGQPGEGVLPDEILDISGGDMMRILFASSYNIFPAYLSTNLDEVNNLLYEDIKGTDLLPNLHKITLPVLTLWGKYDDIIPPQLGRAGFNVLETEDVSKRFVIFDESGHQPFINERLKFANEVIDFVMKR